MCCYNKLSFTLQQSLRPYLREETQGMSGVCTQQWGVPAPAISEPPAGKTQVCLDFLIPASPSSFHRKDTEGYGSDKSPEYPKAATGFQGASSQHVPSPAPTLKDTFVTWTPCTGNHKTQQQFSKFLHQCFIVLCTRCLTDEDQRSALKSVQKSNRRDE